MTSLERELGRPCSIDQVSDAVARAFGRVFDLLPRLASERPAVNAE
jgi:hypothetical protein